MRRLVTITALCTFTVMLVACGGSSGGNSDVGSTVRADAAGALDSNGGDTGTSDGADTGTSDGADTGTSDGADTGIGDGADTGTGDGSGGSCGGGCGGGGDETPDTPTPPPVLTGTFVDGPVAGLEYSTATQSGVTDVAGSFQYIDGETITFSLGGTVLGEPVLAAPSLTPKDLVPGLLLPTASWEVAAYLRNPTDAASAAFIRFLNILVVLQSFDDDADPENGLVIPEGIATLLDGMQLELDVDPADFRARSGIAPIMNEAWASGLLQTAAIRDRGRALDHYYESQGLAATILRLTMRELDQDLDGVVDEARLFSYDVDGNLMREETYRVFNGSIDSIIDRVYDDRGNELSVIEDWNGDHIVDFLETKTYDSNSCLIARIRDRNGDGSRLSYSTYERDANCNLLSLQYDFNNDGIFDTYTYNQLDDDHWTIEGDWEDDGTVDEITEGTITRQPDGGLSRVEIIRRVDDGSIIELHQDDFDSHGNRTLVLVDIGGDGFLDILRSATYTYDNYGFLIKSTHDLEEEHFEPDYSINYVYDSDGVLVMEELDNLDNGEISARFTLSYGPGNWYSFFKAPPKNGAVEP